MSQCMITNCERPMHTRGVCASCYQGLQRKVKAGKFTWNQVMEAGLILPSTSKRGSLGKALQKANLSPLSEAIQKTDLVSGLPKGSYAACKLKHMNIHPGDPQYDTCVKALLKFKLEDSENEAAVQTAINQALEQCRQHARVSVGQPLPAVEPDEASESQESPQEPQGRIIYDSWGPGPQKAIHWGADPKKAPQEPQEEILMASRSPNPKSDSERSSERPVDAEEIPAKSYPNRYLPDHSTTTEGDEVGFSEHIDCPDCNGGGCGRCESQGFDLVKIDELPEEEETEPSEPSIPMTAQEREKNSQERAEIKARRDARKPLDPDDLAEANGLEPYPRLLRQ